MKKVVPNCSLCEWKVTEGWSLNTSMICTAQGYKECYLAYNSKSCKKLYKERDKNG
jgi:hypothetical protein